MKANQNFGVAVHILAYLKINEPNYITSNNLAESINTNPVVIRRILKQLADNNFIITKQGRFGSKINSKLEDITFYDIYKVFYYDNILNAKSNPSTKCDVGLKINKILCSTLNEVQYNFLKSLKMFSINDLIKQIEEGEIT